jgi:hypothetical protein
MITLKCYQVKLAGCKLAFVNGIYIVLVTHAQGKNPLMGFEWFLKIYHVYYQCKKLYSYGANNRVNW